MLLGDGGGGKKSKKKFKNLWDYDEATIAEQMCLISFDM